MLFIVDGHEDIAYNVVVNRRDFRRSAQATRELEGEPHPGVGLCSVSLPDLLAGNVGLVFGTLFTLPASAADSSLPMERSYHNAGEAQAQALEQLAVYRQLATANDICLIQNQADLQGLVAKRQAGGQILGIVLLMENADPVREPDEVGWWFEQGIRLIGPAWQATRYCGGTRHPGPLTAAGRKLLAEMDSAGMVLDVSHMAEESFWQALDCFHGPIIASHSNCRRFAPPSLADRHLSDEMICALIERGAVIGTVSFNAFLTPDYERGQPKEKVGLDALVRHIDHICELAGSARHVALGSDIDGGFGSKNLPRELDTAADFPRIGEALRAAGYSQADTDAILGGNWLRLLEQSLPA
ncbi:MAG: membrane dipeptidase [Chloroflexaceae bacterium]|jgi:membrane dipeptidase|nr:membrane dipeptidase [Chloroflexaceae bacterium]